MNKVRNALGDSSDHAHYIETLPGQGYRFIAAVEMQPGPVIAGSGRVPQSIAKPSSPSGPSPASVRRMTPALIVLAFVAFAFGVWGVANRLPNKPDPGQRPVSFTISAPAGSFYEPPLARQPFAVSPDGTHLAFTATTASGTCIWIREMASLGMRALPATAGVRSIFWSPDSRAVYYSVLGGVKQVNLETGLTSMVASGFPKAAQSGTWRHNGDLLLGASPLNYELLAGSGNLRELPGLGMRWPQFLPHSDRLIYVVYDPALRHYRGMAGDYVTRKSIPLLETDSLVRYAPPRRPGEAGYLLFVRAATLLGQPFDADTSRVQGEPFPIAQNVNYFSPGVSASFSVSDNGILVYQAGLATSELKWYDRSGHAAGTVGRAAPYVGTVRISPDGRKVAAALWSPDKGGMDVWMVDAKGAASRRLTFGPAVYARPVWSPDGKRVAFGRAEGAAPQITTLDLAEGAKEQPLSNSIPHQVEIPTDWSRDGRFIAYDSSLGEEEQQVWVADLAAGKVLPLSPGKVTESGAVFSPDGKWIAFISGESGRPEVYVQAFEASPTPRLVGERRQVSGDSGWLVRWRPDGHELFYVATDNRLYAVQVQAPFRFGEPKSLFRIEGIPQYGTTSDFQFDVTRDGQRFIVSNTGSVPPPPFTVIESWQDKFRK